MAVEMKDTGIEWIKKIPKDWTYARLKYINKNITDGSHFSPEIIDEGKKYITVANIYDNEIHLDEALEISEKDFYELSRAGCKPHFDDVLLTKDGTVGRTAIVQKDNDYVILSSIGILTPGNKIKSKFLKFALDSNYLQEQMVGMKDGSALKRITISKIREFFICYPSITEQDKIADFLDKQTAKIDAIIKTNEEQLEILKKYKKSLITQAVTKGFDNNVKLKDSEILWAGEIPEDWDTAEISHYTTSRSGGTPDRNNMDYWTNGTIPWMASGEVNKERVFDTEEKITDLATRNSSAKIIKKNAVMVALNGQGKTKGMSAILKIDAACNQSLCAFTCNKQVLFYEYLYYCFQCMYKYLRSQAGDNVRDGLAASFVRKQKIPLPPVDLQKQIASFLNTKISKIDSLVEKKQQAIETMQKYKKSLIYEYVTGKKRIK